MTTLLGPFSAIFESIPSSEGSFRPLLLINFGHQNFRTSPASEPGRNPRWADVFEAQPERPRDVVIAIFENDNSGIPISEVRIPLSEVLETGKLNKSVRFFGRGTSGVLSLQVLSTRSNQVLNPGFSEPQNQFFAGTLPPEQNFFNFDSQGGMMGHQRHWGHRHGRGGTNHHGFNRNFNGNQNSQPGYFDPNFKEGAQINPQVFDKVSNIISKYMPGKPQEVPPMYRSEPPSSQLLSSQTSTPFSSLLSSTTSQKEIENQVASPQPGPNTPLNRSRSINEKNSANGFQRRAVTPSKMIIGPENDSIPLSEEEKQALIDGFGLSESEINFSKKPSESEGPKKSSTFGEMIDFLK